MMHQNYYDHYGKDGREKSYRKHISNIAYRYNFQVIYEDERVLKVENGVETVLVTLENARSNTLCYRAWLKLCDEYGYSGIWKDRD